MKVEEGKLRKESYERKVKRKVKEGKERKVKEGRLKRARVEG